jgi:hypothetical protein
MTLTQTILANAAFVANSGVTVTCDTAYSTVSIDSVDGNVFLQDSEADTFNDEVERLWNLAGDVTIEDCRAHMAYDYLHLLTEG